MGNEPTGVCPKCKKYVKEGEEGVLCTGCQAYWHFECAGVDDDILKNEWNNIDFLCENHNNSTVSSVEEQKNIGTLFSDVRVKDYKLNVKEKLKDKLKNIGSPLTIAENDGGRQFTITLNTVSYQIVAQNMVTLGSLLGGIKIINGDMDQNSVSVQCQYSVDICPEISVSITCYHTTSTMSVQLHGRKSEKKVEKLRNFVYTSFSKLIASIEKFPKYPMLCVKIKQDIEQELTGIISNTNILQGAVCNSKANVSLDEVAWIPPCKAPPACEEIINNGETDLASEEVKKESEISGSREIYPVKEVDENTTTAESVVQSRVELQPISGRESEIVGISVSTKCPLISSEETVLNEKESKAVVIVEKPRNNINKKKLLQTFDVMRKNDSKIIDERSER